VERARRRVEEAIILGEGREDGQREGRWEFEESEEETEKQTAEESYGSR